MTSFAKGYCQDTIELTGLRLQFDNLGNPIMYSISSNKLFTGIAVSYSSNHQIELSQEYEYGSLIRETDFYNNHAIKSISNYNSKGLRSGEYAEFDSIGNLSVHGQYVNDELDGLWIYFLNNRISMISQYKLGSKEGTWLYYDIDGNSTKQEKYINNKIVIKN